VRAAVSTSEAIVDARQLPDTEHGLAHGDVVELVPGCIGTNSFGVRDARLVRDGAVLASASSADVELGRAAFVEAAERDWDDELEVIEPTAVRTNGIHARVRIRLDPMSSRS
jgi:hypothetical protein